MSTSTQGSTPPVDAGLFAVIFAAGALGIIRGTIGAAATGAAPLKPTASARPAIAVVLQRRLFAFWDDNRASFRILRFSQNNGAEG